MKNYLEPDIGKTSEMFVDSMDGGIGCGEMICDFCGKTHMCPDRYEDEYDDDLRTFKPYCLSQYNEDPEHTVLHYDVDSIIGRIIDGKTYVLECDCPGPYKYEAFIWEHRNMIRNYLKLRIEHEFKMAENELIRNKLAGI